MSEVMEREVQTPETTAPQQKKVLMIGEGETRMAKPSMLKMIKTMLTNKAVGE